MTLRVIYDIGANTGQDLDYYILKADRVVAVEANPVLCDGLCRRFVTAIAAGRLTVINAVLTAGSMPANVDFFIHRIDHQLSQLPEPKENIDRFERLRLPSLSLADLLDRHGAPWYFKTDVESYDAQLLGALFALQFHPAYISAEYHSVDVFATMVANGGYDAFKLVQATDVPLRFSHHPIRMADGSAKAFNFELHATGPFGEDLPGQWDSAEAFFRRIALANLDWADIHATNVEAASNAPPPGPRQLIRDFLVRRMRKRLGLG